MLYFTQAVSALTGEGLDEAFKWVSRNPSHRRYPLIHGYDVLRRIEMNRKANTTFILQLANNTSNAQIWKNDWDRKSVPQQW